MQHPVPLWAYWLTLNTDKKRIGAKSNEEGGSLMDFVLLDLFGGTTDLFESEQEALQAAVELLDRYRRQATINEWHDPDYMSGIMVMRVSHRATRVRNVTAVSRNLPRSRWDYRIDGVQPAPRKNKLMAVKG
jgi:hypothetical protein